MRVPSGRLLTAAAAGEPAIRPTTAADRDEIGETYAHHVLTGVVTSEETPPTVAPGRADADASLALQRHRGFVDAGRLTSVGCEHGRWLDTLLLQRSLN